MSEIQQALTEDLIRAAFAKKVSLLQVKVGRIEKDRENTFHKYRYVSDDAVLTKVSEAMPEAGLISTPIFDIISSESVSRGEGKAPERIVTVVCELFASDTETGLERRLARTYGSGQDVGDKAVMKAQTAAHKYAWLKALNIPTGDDPEADSSVDKRNAGAAEVPGATRTYVPAAAAGVTAPAPAPDAPQTLKKTIGRIVSVTEAKGPYKSPRKDGQTEWRRFDIMMEDGERYTTFDVKDGQTAAMFAGAENELTCHWIADATGKYRNIQSIEP